MLLSPLLPCTSYFHLPDNVCIGLIYFVLLIKDGPKHQQYVWDFNFKNYQIKRKECYFPFCSQASKSSSALDSTSGVKIVWIIQEFPSLSSHQVPQIRNDMQKSVLMKCLVATIIRKSGRTKSSELIGMILENTEQENRHLEYVRMKLPYAQFFSYRVTFKM